MTYEQWAILMQMNEKKVTDKITNALSITNHYRVWDVTHPSLHQNQFFEG